MATRRDKGSGSIFYAEATKQWVAELKWTDTKGKSHTKRFTSNKKSGKTIVKDKLEKFKRQLIIQTDAVSTTDVTFREYTENWLTNVYRTSVKPSTYIRRVGTLRTVVYQNVGDIQMAKLETADVQNMIGAMVKSGYSYSSIKKAYEAVSSVYEHYASISHLQRNPCKYVTLPSAKEKPVSKIRTFNESERNLIIEECFRKYKTGARVYKTGEAFVIMMFTGLRVGELCALTWDDIDFEKKLIHVTKNASPVNVDDSGEITFRMKTNESPKTYSGNRVIPMSDIVVRCFHSLKETFGQYEYCIARSSGGQIFPGHLNERFHSILKRTGLYIETAAPNENVNGVHSLRHTFATMLFQNGCEVKVVSELLGHASTKITEDIYIHVIQEMRATAIKGIDKYASMPAMSVISDIGK